VRPDGSIRTIEDEGVIAIKGATAVCLKLGGGLTSFARLTRVSGPVLSRYIDIHDPDNFEKVIGVDVAVEADRRAGSPMIISEAARQLGYRLVPEDGQQPQAHKLSDGDVMDFMKEAMDVFNALREARADGRICAADKKAIEEQLRELEREIAEVRANMAEG